ncbi:MAG TPA: hypothetical protein VN677_10290 [Gemmatimonadaceae bacterium]|jgi:hypothetical protein|nr:hypothetical protein [Gemmatimonadaceae bacterium]
MTTMHREPGTPSRSDTRRAWHGSWLGIALLLCPASAAAVQTAAIVAVSVPSSSWRAMTVDVSYRYPALRDTLRLEARWLRLNGRPLDFPPATEIITPGSGHVTLASRYTGLLPPPTPAVLRLSLLAADGHAVTESDCELALVTPQGRPAWAADLLWKRSRQLSWKIRTCHPPARRASQ